MSQANSNVQVKKQSLRPWFQIIYIARVRSICEKRMAMEPPMAFVHAVSKINMATNTPPLLW